MFISFITQEEPKEMIVFMFRIYAWALLSLWRNWSWYRRGPCRPCAPGRPCTPGGPVPLADPAPQVDLPDLLHLQLEEWEELLGIPYYEFHRQKPMSRSCHARNLTFKGLARREPAEIKWGIKQP